MRVIVEVLVQSHDPSGVVREVGWQTDSHGSRYWAGRRWQELVQRDQTARLVDTRGVVLPL